MHQHAAGTHSTKGKVTALLNSCADGTQTALVLKNSYCQKQNCLLAKHRRDFEPFAKLLKANGSIIHRILRQMLLKVVKLKQSRTA